MARPKRPPLRTATTTAPTDSAATPVTTIASPVRHTEGLKPAELTIVACLPSPRLAMLLSAAIVCHLTLIGVSYLATVAASTVQADLLATAAPYLGMTHFDAQQIPLSLSSAAASERTHQLMQAASLQPGDEDWMPIASPGVRGGDRQRRWQRLLAVTAELGENEEGFLAAWLMMPLAQLYPDAQQIRIDREPDFTTTPSDATAPSPYRASIVRQADGTVRLVQVPPQRLTSPSTESGND